MDFVSPLYRTLQAQATLDQTRATTQDTQALAFQRIQNQQLQGLEIQQRMNTQRAMQEVAGGFKGYDPALAPSPDDSATEAMRKEAGRQRADAQFMRNMAVSVAKAGGDMKAVDEWNNRANVASWRATQTARESLSEAKNEMNQVSGAAAAVKDDDSLNAFMQQLSTINGTTAKNLSTQLDRDPYTGMFAYGPKSQNVVNAIVAQGEGAAKRQEIALKAAAQVEKVQDDQRKAQESKARVDELNSVTAVNRERAANLTAEREGTMPAKAGRAGAAKAPATLKPVAAATANEKTSAADAIMADPAFKDQKFDGSVNAFASDVANRAKKIARDNPDMSRDEAEQQAIDELKPFVTGKTVKSGGFGGFFQDEKQVKTYTRGGAGLKAKDSAPAADSVDVQEGRGGKKYQYIGGPNGDRQDKANWKLIGG